jgi:hypothetical protein
MGGDHYIPTDLHHTCDDPNKASQQDKIHCIGKNSAVSCNSFITFAIDVRALPATSWNGIESTEISLRTTVQCFCNESCDTNHKIECNDEFMQLPLNLLAERIVGHILFYLAQAKIT